MYPKIEITKEELIRTVYFILMKYSSDTLHMQGTSSKRDLIGGYIERWINKLAETAIFDELLGTEPYKAISDYFIYDNKSEKNAPDIIGIRSTNKIIPFVRYVDNKWEVVEDSPRIEVKALRKDQYQMNIRETQMIDDYYVFVESDLQPDYLTMIFEDDVFADKYSDMLEANNIFIKSDKFNNIIYPVKPTKSTVVGSFRLIGSYTKEQIRNNTVSCGPGINPWYVKSVENVDKVIGASEGNILGIIKNKFTYRFGTNIYLPMSITGNDRNIKLIKSNKGSMYLKTTADLVINGVKTSAGYVKVEFSKFERSSNWNENVAIKNSFETFAGDSTQEMLLRIRKIYENKDLATE